MTWGDVDEFGFSTLTVERDAEMDTPLRNVRTNIVQSIRAFGVKDLQAAAEQLGHHFLYANLAKAQSKQDVLELIAAQYTLCLLYTSPSPRD